MTTDHTTDLQAWLDRVDAAVRATESAAQRLRTLLPLPAGGTPAERFRALRGLLDRLGLDLRAADPVGGRVRQCEVRLQHCVGLTAAALGDVADQVLRELDRLAAAVADPSLLRTEGLPPPALTFLDLGNTLTGPIAHAAVHVATLPASHALRDVLPPDELFNGLLVLGPADRINQGRQQARAWYARDHAVKLTQDLAWHRRLAEQEHTERAARAQALHEARLRQLPEYRLAELERELAELKGGRAPAPAG